MSTGSGTGRRLTGGVPQGARTGARGALEAKLRALCEERMAPAEGGGMTDVEEIWPSEILAILDGPGENEG